MTGELLIDGSTLSWQDFADRLVALGSSPPSDFGYVRAPRSCAVEAIRLIRHLDLDDRIALATEAARHGDAGALAKRLRDLVGAARAALKAPTLPSRQPYHD